MRWLAEAEDAEDAAWCLRWARREWIHVRAWYRAAPEWRLRSRGDGWLGTRPRRRLASPSARRQNIFEDAHREGDRQAEWCCRWSRRIAVHRNAEGNLPTRSL